MDSKRQYSEQEVAEILERATETQAAVGQTLPATTGMTLAELQDIGREVGISGDLIARAAARLDESPATTLPSRVFMGAQIGVGQTTYFDRRLTDSEWDRLVVELREVFDARGRVRAEGAFRQWTNGNLQALIEPTESGERLRLRTVNGNARRAMAFGAALMGMAPVTLLISVFGASGGGSGGIAAPLIMGAAGALLYGATRIRLPGWASLRKTQMDAISSRLSNAINEETGTDDPE